MYMQLLADAGDAVPFIFGGLGLGFILLILLAFLLATAFWIWMLVDCIGNNALDGAERLVWALGIFFSHFLGSILYFFVVYKKRSVTPRIQSP